MEIDGSPDAIDRSISAYQAFETQERANIALGRQIAALLNARPEIPVTPEMQNIGGNAANEVCLSLFLAKWNSQDAERIAVAAYRAMAAFAPVELVSEGERAALAMRYETMAALMDMRTALDRAETELSTLRTRLAERDASVLKAARHRV